MNPCKIEYPVTAAVILARAEAARSVVDKCPIEMTLARGNEYSNSCVPKIGAADLHSTFASVHAEVYQLVVR